MTALSGYRDTKRMGDDVLPDVLELPLADNIRIFKGAIVGLAGGYAAPAGSGCTKVAGVAEADADNAQPGHVLAAKRVRVRQGTFKFANSGGADALAIADVGTFCYAADDQTVAKTAGQNLPIAGTVIQVDPDGVWVQLSLDGRR